MIIQSRLLIYIIRMGNSQLPPLFPQSKHYSILDYGYCKVWKRNDTHRQTMEEYLIAVENQEQLTRYQEMWQFRMREDRTVAVHYFTHRDSDEMCGVFQRASLLTERIPYRLSQFANIPYEEILNIVKMALQGFKNLYIQYGLFLVRPTMLGINHKNQLKIWLHTDFSQPTPENCNCTSLYDMFTSIINSIQTNADRPQDYIKFSQFVQVNKHKIQPNFDQMLEVLQTYKQMNDIPNFQGLPKLEYYMRRAEGWQESSFDSNFLSNRALVNPSSARQTHPEMGKDSICSNRTLKNRPSMNIYTHKDVNELMQRQKYLNRHLFQREMPSRSNSKVLFVNTSPKSNQRMSPSPINFSPRPNPITKESPCLRLITKSPSEHTRIQFKIIPSIKTSNRHTNPLNSIKPSNSSIQKRISQSPHQRHQPSLYTLPPSPPQQIPRRNRFQMVIDQTNRSHSLNSSIYRLQSLRAQI